MDNNQDIVAGLDIGTTKIACIVGRKNEQGKIEILGMGKSRSDGVSRGVVANIQKTVESIRTAVDEAQESAGVQVHTVNVGIAGQHIRSMQHRGMKMRERLEDEITQNDIDQLIEETYRLVMPPGEEIIHVLPQEYIIDNEQGIRDPIGMGGVRMEANFHIISGQVSAARNINKCVHRAGLNVTELILEPLASADAVLSAEEKEAGVVLVDIGGGTTDIAIFFDHIIRHTAVIPFGGNVVTEDIRQGCGIMRDQAEKLKTKFGSALAAENKENEVVCIPGLRGRDPKEISLRTLAEIIQARMEEILDQVYFEVRNSGIERQLIAGIVLTGGGAQLRHLKQLTEYKTGMTTRIGYPNEHVAKSAVEDVTSPLHATGVGLVMKGLAHMAERVRAGDGQSPVQEPTPVAGHSRNILGAFFDRVSEFLKDDEN
ncbi:MAG: cell division protein FtsA [Flavobacteriales bacterium]|jgi:cell division protein FtsA|nr:cell division protein FtsA [Flavobacteriales bacterium]